MIKLCGSYGLKIPGPKEFSSESYHASAEIELAGTADGEGLKAALGLLWEDLKSAVEAQIAAKAAQPARSTPQAGSGTASQQQAAPAAASTRQTAPQGRPANANRGSSEPATKKQISFLLSLARRNRNFSAEQTRQWVQAEHGLKFDSLTKTEAAKLIDQLQGK